MGARSVAAGILLHELRSVDLAGAPAQPQGCRSVNHACCQGVGLGHTGAQLLCSRHALPHLPPHPPRSLRSPGRPDCPSGRAPGGRPPPPAAAAPPPACRAAPPGRGKGRWASAGARHAAAGCTSSLCRCILPEAPTASSPPHLRPSVEAAQANDAHALPAAAALKLGGHGRGEHAHRPPQQHLLLAAIEFAHLRGAGSRSR